LVVRLEYSTRRAGLMLSQILGLKYSTLEAKGKALFYGIAIESSVQFLLDNLDRTSAILTFRSVGSVVQSSKTATYTKSFFTFSNRERTVGKGKEL